MNELVYVLAVEALVFGALCTVLVAQRLNVFIWPAAQTWPVLASCVQVLLLTAHVLLLLCCFIAAGRFGSFAPDVRDASARSAGRLATAAMLSCVYVAALLAARWGAGDCVLCQLLGTSCATPGIAAGSWSYEAYVAVLLPVAAFQAALLLAAAGMCKERRVVPRRVATANFAVLLALQVHSVLEGNMKRLPGRCGAGLEASADGGKVSLVNTHVLVLFFIFYALDASADLAAGLVLGGRAGQRLPLFFTLCRTAQLAAPWVLQTLWDGGELPWQVLLGHSALALLLAALDVADIWLGHFEAHESQVQGEGSVAAEKQLHALSTPKQETLVSAAALRSSVPTRPAFEIEPARRHRFVLAFNNKPRWSTHVAAKKKE
jgi:hypothetical protein